MDDPSDIRNWRRRPDGITTSGKLEPGDPARLAAIGVRHVINLADLPCHLFIIWLLFQKFCQERIFHLAGDAGQCLDNPVRTERHICLGIAALMDGDNPAVTNRGGCIHYHFCHLGKGAGQAAHPCQRVHVIGIKAAGNDDQIWRKGANGWQD